MNNYTKGFLATVASAVFFGFVPLFVRTIVAGGANTTVVSFYRFFLTLPVLLPYLLIKGTSLKITWQEFWRICLITICGYGGTSILLFSALNFIPSGMTTTLHFTYPVLTILGCVLFCHEKIRREKVISAALCMIGILLFYDGDGSADLLGMGLALASGLTYAFYTIYLGKSILQKMDSMKLIFYMNAVASAMMFLLSLFTDQFTWHLTPTAWAVAIFFAIATTVIGVLGYQIGVRYIGPQNTSILSTFEPITSVIVGILVYSEDLTLRTCLGCVSILASVIIVARLKEAQENTQDNTQVEETY